jgi:HPt (histidine-containing phosphotransfer) domain-containing protein
MTANAMEGDREKCLDVGMDDYIPKPVTIEGIKKSLEKWGNQVKTEKIKRSDPDDIMDWKMIDSIRSLDLGDDEASLLLELVYAFIEEYPDNIDKLKESLKQNDPEKVLKIAHKMKGSGANLGAKGYAKVCYKFEVKGKTNDLSNTDELFVKLDEMYQKTLVEFKKYLSRFNKELKI